MNKKAFTMIEVSIVSLILGILITTALPRLTSSHERTRDTKRMADLTATAQALLMYNNETGLFPNSSNGCLDKNHTTGSGVVNSIKKYLIKGKAPKDPLKNSKIGTGAINICENGLFYYSSLKAKGFDNGGYILCANIENYSKANFLSGNLPINNTELSSVINSKILKITSEEDSERNTSLYCIVE